MSFTKNIFCVVASLFLCQASNHLLGTNGIIDNNRSLRIRSSSSSSSRLRPTIDVRQKIVEWQCYAKCSLLVISSPKTFNFDACRKKCMTDLYTLPRRGQCPHGPYSEGNELIFKVACLDECKVDFDCPEVKKCCISLCGPVCLRPLHISDDELLPPIPKIIHLKIPKGHKVEITMQTSANTTIYYHVEARYHIGIQFSPRKFGVWQWQPVVMMAEEILENKKKRIQICFNLKPGRWYQVRMAAINVYGFRGYSEPSKSFTLSKHPGPPLAPTDLQVVDVEFNGKHYTINIVWCPAKSTLPVEKYKVIWSLYVKSNDESMISNEAFVRDNHQFQIANLLPESSYYIQVLAMCISGSRRLKSEKISIMFNSTINEYRKKTHKCLKPIKRQGNDNHLIKNHVILNKPLTTILPNAVTSTTFSYGVRFRLNQKYGITAQITGFRPDKEKIYELCSRDANCEHKYRAIRARKHSLEFNKLKYNTTYLLKEIEPATGTEYWQKLHAMKSSNCFSFHTPKCENLRERFPKMQINC